MKKTRILITALILSMAFFAAACGSPQPEVESTVEPTDQQEPTFEPATPEPTVEVVQPTHTIEEPSAADTTQRYTFEQLGISLEIPTDLYVKKAPSVKYEDQSKLESYLFYIQNYGNPGGLNSGDFQMYGHLQYDLPPISWDEFSNNQVNSLMNAYADYIEVGGLRGYDTQVAGVRNRFVYHFYLEGRVLSIYVAEPTPENKAFADQIINSLELLPGGLSDASHMRLVSDPNQLYQILIPDDWDNEVQPAAGIMLAGLRAESPDFEFISVDEGGPHWNAYYKSGVSMQLHVLEDNSANHAAFPNRTEQQYIVYLNGIQGTEYVFTDPSTVEGEMREVRVYYDGKSYLLSFAYANDTYRDVIDRIIANFNITPETFYPLQ